MSFESLVQIEAALMNGRVDPRTLFELWERREPVTDPSTKKRGQAETNHSQLAWMQWNASLLPRFTAEAIAAEEYLLVCDAAREGLRLESNATESDRVHFLRLRLDFAKALHRLGSHTDSRRQLEPFKSTETGRRLKSEAFELLGDLARDEADTLPTKAARAQILEEALDFYRLALGLDETRFETRISAAEIALTLGAHEEASQLAEEILRRAQALEDDRGICLPSLFGRAAAFAILGKIDDALKIFGKLKDLPTATTPQLAEARYRAQLLSKAIGQTASFFSPAFPPLSFLYLRDIYQARIVSPLGQ